MATINLIQFKRGNKEALETILVAEKKPLEGEPIWEIDTNKIKIGNGVNDYKDLTYIGGGEVIDDNILYKGYYDAENNTFWKEQSKVNPFPKLKNKFYYNIPTGELYNYFYDENKFIGCILYATSSKAGIVKLYNSLGDNTDGTITQREITDNFNQIAFGLDANDPSCLILKKKSL